MTVRIILEPYTYSTKIVRRRLSPLLLYWVTFALRSCEMYLHEWRSIQCESTGMQHLSCATNTITTRLSKNVNYSCWVHKHFEHVQKLRTGLPKLHAREESCSNRLSLSLSLSLSLLEWPRMTMNDHSNQLEWSIRARSGTDSGQWDWGINVHILLDIQYFLTKLCLFIKCID